MTFCLVHVRLDVQPQGACALATLSSTRPFTSGGRARVMDIWPHRSLPSALGRRALRPPRAVHLCGVRFNGLVDRLVGGMHAGLVGSKGARCAGDLLRDQRQISMCETTGHVVRKRSLSACRGLACLACTAPYLPTH